VQYDQDNSTRKERAYFLFNDSIMLADIRKVIRISPCLFSAVFA
jgi:hypothetical protein